MSSVQLDAEKLLKLLDNDGIVSRYLPGYEMREEQRNMMKNVIDAFNDNHIALIEAGTGTGKSMAYLIPSLIASAAFKEKVVISTNTIALQEQLIEKDIPLIANALNLNLKVVLAKGMNNYVCLRKLDDLQFEMKLLPERERDELKQIEENRGTSTKSQLPFTPSPHVWELVGAEHDLCNHVECPHYQHCPYFQSRRQASDASIIIVNHHLLFADLAMRAETDNYTNQAVLPPYKRLILDEAHNIEDIATEYFAGHVSRLEILRILSRLSSDKTGKDAGKLALLKDKLHSFFIKSPSHEGTLLFQYLATEIPAIKWELQKNINETFLNFHRYMHAEIKSSEGTEEGKLRLMPQHMENKFWQENISPLVNTLVEQLRKYIHSLTTIEEKIKWMNEEKLTEQTKTLCFEVKALSLRLQEMELGLKDFMQASSSFGKVKWIESESFRSGTHTSLRNAHLDISELLVSRLFDKFETIILSSATLTSNKQFSFLKSRLGLKAPFSEKRTITENIYESPFDFSKQVLLLIPQDLPSPLSEDFLEHSSHFILKAIEASRGNAFVLFTSYQMLKSCAARLSVPLQEKKFHLLKQGDESRRTLIERFKKKDRSVLFGTDSFWEGVDVAGDALRCVIIVKLPFKVPSDPLLQARAEELTAKGLNPFFNYFLPQAVVKFKQGFGRLVRNKKDRGCILCLDNRLINKAYGKIFLDSLPECRQIFAPSSTIQKYMKDFYKTQQNNN